MVVIDGMEKRIERIMEVDINSFEEKYGDYLSQEQVAREYFVSTGTVTSWVKRKDRAECRIPVRQQIHLHVQSGRCRKIPERIKHQRT